MRLTIDQHARRARTLKNPTPWATVYGMHFRLLALLTLLGCPGGDTGKDSGDSDDTDETGDTGTTDCPDGSAPETWYADADSDNYGDAAAATTACDPPTGTVDNDLDCDDADAQVNPDAIELCNDEDDDCDGATDEDVGTTWFADTDLDGVGDAANAVTACSAPAGYVAEAGDCDDRNENVYPGAVDVCSGIDEDCDGTLDDEQTGVLVATDGTVTDITAALAAGTADAPTYIGDQDGYTVHLDTGEVRLCEGLYYAKIVVADLGSDLAVIGLYGPEATILTTDGTSGGDDGSIIAVTEATLRIEGLTITGGVGSEGNTKGGGVAITQSGAVAMTPNITFTDSIITGNTTDYGGGIALLDYGSVWLTDTLIFGNTANEVGGGVWVQEHGELYCSATTVGGAGVIANESPIAGGFYFSSKSSGELSSTGCDWGDAGLDDNSVNDVQRQPHFDNAWCFGNATAVTDSVVCDSTGCTGTHEVACP